jgi:hypothetical protein
MWPQTESRLPADGSRRSRNRLSITVICSVSFLNRPNLRPNKWIVVKEKFPHADLCPFPAIPMTVELWDNSFYELRAPWLEVIIRMV